MLRDTSAGNELALPLPMPWKEHSVAIGILYAWVTGIAWVTSLCWLLILVQGRHT